MNATHELATHLGKNFESGHLVWDATKLTRTLEAFKDWYAFQNDKEALYLYTRRETNDLAWLPHIAFVREVQAAQPQTKDALDFMCATGWNGMRFGATAFADYKTRCSDFLRQRVKRRNLDVKVYDLGKDAVPIYPCVVCFDAAHRFEDPLDLVATLAQLGEFVVMDADSRQVDALALVDVIGDAYHIINHRVVNHYVHLVAFLTDAQIEEE